jgi:hypothetical protein
MMTNTAEDLYAETVERLTRDIVEEHLSQGVDYLTVAEALSEEGFDGDEIITDVYESVNSELDTILQRWEDD